jgi:hypothetical protein
MSRSSSLRALLTCPTRTLALFRICSGNGPVEGGVMIRCLFQSCSLLLGREGFAKWAKFLPSLALVIALTTMVGGCGTGHSDTPPLQRLRLPGRQIRPTVSWVMRTRLTSPLLSPGEIPLLMWLLHAA